MATPLPFHNCECPERSGANWDRTDVRQTRHRTLDAAREFIDVGSTVVVGGNPEDEVVRVAQDRDRGRSCSAIGGIGNNRMTSRPIMFIRRRGPGTFVANVATPR